ncbi:hypothetical protein F66182_1848 [Fusarium sp. NRRL 66182]|nr:hypothetical protein F66182_1848 [Fusarium sp. NRRL 66182]
MLPRWSRLWALLCLILVIQHVSGEVYRIAPRADDDERQRTAAIDSGSTSTRESTSITKVTETSVKETEESQVTGSESETESVSVTATETEETQTSDPTSTSTNALDNSPYYNDTIPAGSLPIEPRLTPGWGVAGTILLLTGITYALIGFKRPMIHTFFSTAFATALGVTVLIIYVMKSGVSDALQGGYVVAVVISGSILGGASMFYKEITEGLGCALGGFCVSMWLLCLVPGGLLEPVVSKAIFIACFTAGGFAFYFSQHTRDWALILMIAFSGATVTVLGIDCFSRAGLKEFWAYVWELNDDLFPLGADTYPVTKGIRVETAAIVIIFIFGVVSQIKLWKIVQEKRAKEAEAAAEGERSLREEEEQVGRDIEEANARERRQWERIYGDGDARSSTASRTSGDGGISTEKLQDSQTDSKRQSASIVEVFEMTDMPDPEQPKKQPTVTLMSSEIDKDGRVTVLVAADENRQPSMEKLDKEGPADADASGRELSITHDQADKCMSSQPLVTKSQAPAVVPLPFIVPVADDTLNDGDRSSVATFADEEDTGLRTPGHRHSLAKRLSRLSRGSMELLGNISHRSSRVFGDHQEHEQGTSTEELVISRSCPRDDDGSVAATVDNESLSGSDHQSLPTSEPPKSIRINAKLSEKDSNEAEPLAGDAGGDVKSATSGSSTRVGLTKDRLPMRMSRVAISYRTNEWAKHLSNADAPEPEEIQINIPRAAPITEKPAPVHVDELGKSSNEGTPAPAIIRPNSQASNHSRRSVKQHVPAALAILTGESQNRSPGTTPTGGAMPRSASGGSRMVSGGIAPIAEERDGSSLAPPILEGEPMVSLAPNPPVNTSEASRLSTPGVVSYSSPQTLMGQRDMYLRNKSAGNTLASSSEINIHNRYRASSDAGSLNNYPMYAAAMGVDVDNMPLNQRKELMRQTSLNPSTSTPSLQRLSGGSNGTGIPNLEASFNSHQPKRISTLPTSVVRENALANFRQSVQHELRAGAPVISNTGRETPFTPKSLLASREVEVQRNVDMSRNILLSQKEAEYQRREMEQREKEWADRAFDERMRSGDLLSVHRQAMRKLQGHAKDR